MDPWEEGGKEEPGCRNEIREKCSGLLPPRQESGEEIRRDIGIQSLNEITKKNRTGWCESLNRILPHKRLPVAILDTSRLEGETPAERGGDGSGTGRLEPIPWSGDDDDDDDDDGDECYHV